MLKNFKSLFIKSDEEEESKPAAETFSFPVNNPTHNVTSAQAPVSNTQTISAPAIAEVIKVYENGLESINMPGYDFYEFYHSVNSAGNNEQAYNMAYKMATVLDKTVTVQKLVHDADFYISKINEVYNQYVTQGKSKINSINDKKSAEKSTLTTEIEQADTKILQLKEELKKLEEEITTKKNKLAKIDESYISQEKNIHERLAANDHAHKTSIDKLIAVKEGISTYIKS
ncbi:hypothetical protein [Mucilaginibacter hurinus]|nr:hypothetical protein [Mucilaginibacter hurinus]